jgi:hypothetical protein
MCNYIVYRCGFYMFMILERLKFHIFIYQPVSSHVTTTQKIESSLQYHVSHKLVSEWR